MDKIRNSLRHNRVVNSQRQAGRGKEKGGNVGELRRNTRFLKGNRGGVGVCQSTLSEYKRGTVEI